jgi:hypothetical protein
VEKSSGALDGHGMQALSPESVNPGHPHFTKLNLVSLEQKDASVG